VEINSADLNLAEITQNTHNLHRTLTETARWPSVTYPILADAGAAFAAFLTSSGDQRMVDLYLSLGIMIALCGLAGFAGAKLQKRAGRVIIFCTEIVVCLATAAYLQYLWDRPLLSRLLPFSGAVILGNWLPVVGSFFLGVFLKTESITQARRIVLASVMVGISGYSLAKPMLGQPPACIPSFEHRTLDFQTTNQT
jgi:Mn2+/Fe2+ NRAMP family transporter